MAELSEEDFEVDLDDDFEIPDELLFENDSAEKVLVEELDLDDSFNEDDIAEEIPLLVFVNDEEVWYDEPSLVGLFCLSVCLA